MRVMLDKRREEGEKERRKKQIACKMSCLGLVLWCGFVCVSVWRLIRSIVHFRVEVRRLSVEKGSGWQSTDR